MGSTSGQRHLSNGRKKSNRPARRQNNLRKSWGKLLWSPLTVPILAFFAAAVAIVTFNVGFSLDETAVANLSDWSTLTAFRETGYHRSKPEVYLSTMINTTSIQKKRVPDNNLQFSETKDDASFRVSFDWKNGVDRGTDRFSPLQPLREGNNEPNFDGLVFYSIKEESYKLGRLVSSREVPIYEKYREDQLSSELASIPVDNFYDNDPLEDEPRECRKPSWVYLRFPTCNTMHEVTFDRPRDGYLQDYSFKRVGEGTFRQTYVFKDGSDGNDFAMKTLLFKSHFDSYMRQQLYIVPLEGLIMERLSASPHIIDIYNFCGTTSMMETMAGEVNEYIESGSGKANQTLLDELDDVYPQNDLNPIEKVQVALEMVKSIADLSGFKDGVIVHGDTHIDQFLANADGYIKLGDFNLASILEWNDKKGEYCKREREPWAFRFRAPEEIGGAPFDEKIDVFTLGNSIYSLITGLRPFYDNRKARQVCAHILDGKRGFVDPRYRKRSHMETKLLEILDSVWQHDPNDRPDIFSVMESLRTLGGKNSDEAYRLGVNN